jgi:hypothetical protein
MGSSATLPSDNPREISRETMAALPISRYEVEVVRVAAHRELVWATNDIQSERVVGWDTGVGQ